MVTHTKRNLSIYLFVISFIVVFGLWINNKSGLCYSLAYFVKVFTTSFFIVLILTPLAEIISRKVKALDMPSERKIHKEPMPLLGGVAIYLGFLSIIFFLNPLSEQMKSILIGGTIIFAIGTIDDIHPISSKVRLFGQLAASLIIISSGLVVSFMPDTPWGYLVGAIITIIWILGIINALNFADGVDGLGTGIAIIAGLFFFLITFHLQGYSLALASAILVGCGCGFLFHNFKPATIYLGDGGSTFFGFLLASFALYGGWSSKGPVIALGIPVLILGVLIFDMCYITMSRIRNGKVTNIKEWLDYTGKDHFHHRLIQLGFSERQTVLFIYFACIISGLSALTLEHTYNWFYVAVLVLQSVLIFIIISLLMIVGRRLKNQSE